MLFDEHIKESPHEIAMALQESLENLSLKDDDINVLAFIIKKDQAATITSGADAMSMVKMLSSMAMSRDTPVGEILYLVSEMVWGGITPEDQVQ